MLPEVGHREESENFCHPERLTWVWGTTENAMVGVEGVDAGSATRMMNQTLFPPQFKLVRQQPIKIPSTRQGKTQIKRFRTVDFGSVVTKRGSPRPLVVVMRRTGAPDIKAVWW